MANRIQFEAVVGSGGELTPTGALGRQAQIRLSAWQKRAVLVTVEPERKQRSLKANAWYWTCILPFVAEILSVTRDVPISADQAHYVCKAAFLGVVETPLGPVPKSTARLPPDGFAQYCERITAHFAAEGKQLPALEDR